MRTIQQVIDEIDRLISFYGGMSTAELALDDLRTWILSEPDKKCDHDFANLGLNPDFNYSNAYFLQKCTKCGETK